MISLRCLLCKGLFSAEAFLLHVHPVSSTGANPSPGSSRAEAPATSARDFLSTQGVSPAPVSASPSAVTPARLVPDTAGGTLA